MQLVLFDIDGTLLRSNGVGRLATRAAMLEIFGTVSSLDTHSFGGKTDWFTLIKLLSEHGHTKDTIGQKMSEYMASLERHMTYYIRDSPTWALPHALEIIEYLRKQDDIEIGIITGNTSASAKVKLRGAGFDPEWFGPSAYGDEAVDRNDLARLAVKRAGTLENVIVVGDTVLDVQCARAVDAVAVAVKTGYEDPEKLKNSQPDYLLEDLSGFLRIIPLDGI